MAPDAAPTSWHRNRDAVSAVVGLAVLCVATYALTRLSLDNVSGVTRHPTGGCCDVSFVNNFWWQMLALAVLPIWWVARTLPWAALAAVAIPTYATFHIASTIVQRYDDSGMGDGLEVFSFFFSIVHLAVFVIAAAVGIRLWRRNARRTSGGTQAVMG